MAAEHVSGSESDKGFTTGNYGVLTTSAGHMDAVIARLEDSDYYVRGTAVETLGKLEPAALAQHEQAIAKAAEEDEDSDVRRAAANVLAKLQAGK